MRAGSPTGKRLLRDETTFSKLELIESSVTTKGVFLTGYRPVAG